MIESYSLILSWIVREDFSEKKVFELRSKTQDVFTHEK